MTKNEILTIDVEISQMNTAHKYFNRGKIKDWNTKYGGLAQIFRKEANALRDEYFVIENGIIKTDDTPQGLVTKEGKTITDFQEAYQKWGSKEV